MDIIFKFGEHYYENPENSFWIQLLISAIGAFLGFAFALLGYYYKTKKDKRKERNKLLDESKNKIKYYLILIENIINIIEQQELRITQFIEFQRKDKLELATLKRTASNDFKRIHTIDSRGIFESLELFSANEPNWIDEYKNLNSYLDYLEFASIDIYNIYDANYNEYFNEIKRISSLVENIPNRLSTIGFNLSKEMNNKSDEYLFVDKFLNLYMKLVDSDSKISNLNSKFIIPMLSELNEKLDKYSFAEEFSFYCQEIIRRIALLETEIEEFLIDVEKSIPSLEKHKELLKLSKGRIEKRALTSSCFHWG